MITAFLLMIFAVLLPFCAVGAFSEYREKKGVDNLTAYLALTGGIIIVIINIIILYVILVIK